MQNANDQVTIEKVNSSNFKRFADLIRKLAEYEKLEPPNLAAEARLRNDCLSENPRFEAFLAIRHSVAVGYVIYFFTYSSFSALPSLFLEDIFVLEDYRRQGIGGMLFDFCKSKALEKGCGRMEFTVLEWNKSAQKFYEERKAQRLRWYFYRLNKNDF
jgi:GNAT superfamily N-acetyltransferase